MKNFGIGLGVGLAGLAVWGFSSIVAGTAEAFEESQPWFGQPLMVLGFAAMFLGPLTFWIILPIIKLVRRRRQ